MVSVWNNKFYEVILYINFDNFSSTKNRYYQTFLDKNFMLLKNLSIKYNFEYSSYKFFDEVVTLLIVNKKEYILFFFNIENYIYDKNKFIYFLNENDVYFNIIAVKYKNNFYDINFFENFMDDVHDRILEDFIVTAHVLFINDLCKNKILLFLLIKVVLDFNVLFKCQLYIKQLQK